MYIYCSGGLMDEKLDLLGRTTSSSALYIHMPFFWLSSEREAYLMH